jgi:hypothetical protein
MIKANQYGITVCKKYAKQWMDILRICFSVEILREVRCQSWGILLSHPFQGKIDFYKEKYLIDK